MRKVKLAIIAKLPTFITWCEKKYPHFQLEWFKSRQDYEAQQGSPNGHTKIVLTEQPLDTAYPCIDLNQFDVYKNSQKLERFIDNLVMYDTLANLVRRPSELPLS